MEFIGDLAAEPIELLIHSDDTCADELDLVHQAVGDDVEVPARLGRARRDLGADLGQERRRERRGQLRGQLGLQLGFQLRLQLRETPVEVM